MDEKEKKELNIEIPKNEFVAVAIYENHFDGRIDTNVCRCDI